MLTGMILAAGLGTRLQPITDNLPKPLVPFMGKPMIYYVVEKMKSFGIERIVVNTHHHREKIIEYFFNNDFGVEIIISDEKEEHLLTGGGIKNAAKYFGEYDNVLVHNADIFSSINYSGLVEYHTLKKADVTLAVRNKDDERVFCFDRNLRLAGWKNKSTGEKRVSLFKENSVEYGFTGIYLLSKKAISEFPEKRKFSIVDFFLEYTKVNNAIGFVDDSEYWFDLGSVEKLQNAEDYFRAKGINEIKGTV